MLNKPNRVAAIQDISGFGRCSLTVILPVLSAMGVQVCPVPTAVLSTHTGYPSGVVIRDLTDYTLPCLEHYKSLGLAFECIYSGFLSSQEQVDHCIEFLDTYHSAFKVVDPVMGDHGKPYRTCDEGLRRRMGELAARGDVITPNLTEAAMLLGEDVTTQALSHAAAKSWLVRLSELGPRFVVITGVAMNDASICNLGYDRERNAFWRVRCEYVPVSYPGTGDIFASVLVGGMLTGDSLPIAMDRATRYIEYTIKTTFSYGTDPRRGVMLEKTLPWLMAEQTLKNYEIL